MPKTTTNSGKPALSPKERELLEIAAQGLTDKEIAVKTGVSITTIRTYWERIRIKLGAINRTHCVTLGLADNRADDAAQEVSDFILRNIADAAIFTVDADAQILTWNQGVKALFGYEEAEWVGKNQSIFFLPEEKSDAVREVVAAESLGASVFDRWHVRKDGSRFWGTNTMIKLDETGHSGWFAKIVRPKPRPKDSN